MKRRGFLLGLSVLLLAAFAAGQLALQMHHTSAASVRKGLLAAVGGLRSIAAEIIWFRADRLQEEGRYVELTQLAEALTTMEPHTPEVWSYAAWNLAYNISVMMSSLEDRWRWVHAALEMLRDRALVYNPQSPELFCELAWLFELKLGTDIDAAAAIYRRNWAEIVRDVARRGTWEELRMDRVRMGLIERATGFSDWEDPRLSAIYWASQGLASATGRERAMLLEIIRQSRVLYTKNHPDLIKYQKLEK